MTSPTTLIHSALLVENGHETPDAWVRFDGDTVGHCGTGTSWRDELDAAATIVDARGRVLAPGFIDLHNHGGGGTAFATGPEAIATALDMHMQHGTTKCVLSLVTAPLDVLVPQLEAIAMLLDTDDRILGSHLEGPFLDHDFRGAHDPDLLRTADPSSIDRLLGAAAGSLVQVTIAPEHDGAIAAVAQFVDADVRVAVGHTGADYETSLQAFDAGASILTHAFNGMRGMHHRAPGPVVAAMHAPQVTLEIVNDGVHIHPDVVALAFRGAPGRVALITDAMDAAGFRDGDYMLGSLEVVVDQGVARLSSSGSIAGSTLTLDDAVRRAVQCSGVALADAIAAVTSIPAATIGRDDDLGRLAPGYRADAVLLTDDFSVDAVWVAGAERSRTKL